MVDQLNFERNKLSDENRIKTIQSSKIFNVFNNQVWKKLFYFFKFIKFKLIIVTIISFISALLEGLKAASIILLITISLSSEEKFLDFQNNFFVSKILYFNNFLEIETRYFLILFLFLSLIILTLKSVTIKVIISWLNEKLTSSLLRIVRSNVLEKLFSFNIRYFTQAKSGELIFLTTSETNRFSVLVNIFINSFSLIIQFLIFYTILIYMFWNFTLLLTLIGFIYFLIHLKLDKKLKILSWTQNVLMNNLSQYIHQTIYGIKIIKIAGLEKRQSKEYLSKHREYEKQRIEAGLYSGISKGLQEIILFISLSLILLLIIQSYSLSYIINNSENFIAYLFLLLRTMPVILHLQTVRSNLINAYGPLARVMDLLFNDQNEFHTDKKKNKNILISNIESIILNNLKFQYEKKQILNIDQFSFKKNKLIAIVGKSGSGKSTLLDLISNLITPSQGQILINGIDLKNLQTESFQSKLGYMNQEPIIFHDTVRNNINFFDKSSTEAELYSALKLACAYEFVNELENKLDQSIGERGQTLSGGQKQRLGLTRIFLQNPELILLDEATNALDFNTEKMIYNNVKNIAHDKLVIIAAHRLSALIEFDEIIVLNNGKISEIGNHFELMKMQGIYFDMFNAQLKNT